MALTPEEIQRYKRHLVLHDIGGQGQARLKAARVLVVGAGGLGSPVLLYLAAAGVGTLGIIDDDKVSLDNLQRQVIHTTALVGIDKVESAADTIRRLNPHVTVETFATRLDAANAADVIGRYDLVVDGSDNFATRYLVSDACYFAGRTLIHAAAGPLDGYVTTLKPYVRLSDGTPYPSYRCIFPEAPPPGTVANCSEVGVLGSVVGVLGTLQATEAIKEITGAGETLAGKLLLYDAKDSRFETVRVKWDPDNPLSGRAPSILDLSVHVATRAVPPVTGRTCETG
jgi:adenylyltransferase/sulfurtransferase